jgi:cytochrome c biogenesis protein ResB
MKDMVKKIWKALESVRLPHSEIQVRLGSMDVRYYQGGRLKFLNNRAVSVQAALLLTAGQKEVWKTIGINAPFRFNGLSFHLKDFAPQYKSGMRRRHYINLIIKDDPGMMFYFTGTMLFIAGLCMYLCQWSLLSAKEGKRHG